MCEIELCELTKRYGSTPVVEDLNVTISTGEIYGFLGPNGAGKTTTIRMLTTLLPPTDGQAWISGTSIYDVDNIRSHIGYLPESPPLYSELTAFEQLSLAADLHDIPENYATKRIESLLSDFPWSDVADEPIADYSTGMKKTVGFIQAILHEPDVLFLDEPISGLDPRATRTFQEMITDLADNDTTIFLSTHILPIVEELADTVGVLFEGSLIAEDSPDRLKQQAQSATESTLEDAFLELTTDKSITAKENDG